MLTVEGFVWTLLAIVLIPAMSTAAAVLLVVAASEAWTRWRTRRAGSGATFARYERPCPATVEDTLPSTRSST